MRYLLVLGLLLAIAPSATQIRAGSDVSGSASSSVIPCLQVGPDYLSPAINQYSYEQEVWLNWTGTVTSARVVGYEFNASGTYGRNIYLNDDPKPVGTATGTRASQPQCRGFEGLQPLSWEIKNLGNLRQGRNVIRITMDPATSETGWGISRAQIEITGVDVDGRHYTQVTVPSTYFNNGASYQNEGAWTHIMTPASYRSNIAAPLLIVTHGYGSTGLEAMLDYHDAAAARGWLLASADYHGEVYSGFYAADTETGQPYQTTGRRTMGSRASQWDVLDIVNYMQANYKVDFSRIYLVGHSMGGMTALLTGARAADRFAAVVADSSPTDLLAWEGETVAEGITPNASINYAIRAETGVYSEPNHWLAATRVPSDYPFEYERRSPVEFAANFKNLPLLILHPAGDKKVDPHHAEDLYLIASRYAPAHLERIYFPGQHGDRLPDFANTELDWLAQFTRPDNDAPQVLDFALDWSGAHFWITAQYSSGDLNEAHWLRVKNARYDRSARVIQADITNLKPLNGDYPANALSVPAPRNLNVVLTFDAARVGLPSAGMYTVDLVGKDDGSFSQSFQAAAQGKISVTVPAGAYIVRLTAGDAPPVTQVLRLRQGADGYNGVQDTYLSNWSPDTNYATSSGFSLRIANRAPAHNGILKFDLSPASGLPAGAQVRYAVVSFQVRESYPKNTLPVQLDAVTRPWGVGEATWNRATAGALWTQPGAEGVPSDRSGAILDERYVYPTSEVTSRYGFDVTGAVRNWLVAPAANYGVLLRIVIPEGIATTPAYDGFNFATSEYSLADRRPQLTLVYTLQTYTPTPTNTATVTSTATATPTATNTPTVTPTSDAGSIQGTMFLDDNRNGIQDPGEAARPGKLIQLKQHGDVVNNVTTDAAGRYRFVNLRPGSYQVFATDLPAVYMVTTGSNPADVAVFTATEAIVDFGLAPALTVTVTPTQRPTYSHLNYLPLILSGGSGG